jgi:signal transduction histidine kinase
VIDACDGTDGLPPVGEPHTRLVILDLDVPGMDGRDISATYLREEDTVRALEGGAVACATEPVEPPVLVATLRALLRAGEAEAALREVLASERTARARAEAANRTKDEFLATLSHELRSPLAAILSWVTLMRTRQLDGARTACALEAIERNTRLQVRLIEDLLDVSRVMSGRMRLEVGRSTSWRSSRRRPRASAPPRMRRPSGWRW